LIIFEDLQSFLLIPRTFFFYTSGEKSGLTLPYHYLKMPTNHFPVIPFTIVRDYLTLCSDLPGSSAREMAFLLNPAL